METEMELIDLYLSSYCLSQIEKIIDHAIERMVIESVTERADKIIVAEENLKHLLEYFRDHAKSLGTYPFLDDNAFDTALAGCYPLWPYC